MCIHFVYHLFLFIPKIRRCLFHIQRQWSRLPQPHNQFISPEGSFILSFSSCRTISFLGAFLVLPHLIYCRHKGECWKLFSCCPCANEKLTSGASHREQEFLEKPETPSWSLMPFKKWMELPSLADCCGLGATAAAGASSASPSWMCNIPSTGVFLKPGWAFWDSCNLSLPVAACRTERPRVDSGHGGNLHLRMEESQNPRLEGT